MFKRVMLNPLGKQHNGPRKHGQHWPRKSKNKLLGVRVWMLLGYVNAARVAVGFFCCSHCTGGKKKHKK